MSWKERTSISQRLAVQRGGVELPSECSAVTSAAQRRKGGKKGLARTGGGGRMRSVGGPAKTTWEKRKKDFSQIRATLPTIVRSQMREKKGGGRKSGGEFGLLTKLSKLRRQKGGTKTRRNSKIELPKRPSSTSWLKVALSVERRG